MRHLLTHMLENGAGNQAKMDVLYTGQLGHHRQKLVPCVVPILIVLKSAQVQGMNSPPQEKLDSLFPIHHFDISKFYITPKYWILCQVPPSSTNQTDSCQVVHVEVLKYTEHAVESSVQLLDVAVARVDARLPVSCRSTAL